MQASARRFLGRARVLRRLEVEKQEHKKQVLDTLAVPRAEYYARVIQDIYKAYKVTSQAKYSPALSFTAERLPCPLIHR